MVKIKQSIATRTVNDLLASLESSKRNFSDAVVSMSQTKESMFESGYRIYGKFNDRGISFYGHLNFVKILLRFEEHGKEYITNDMQEARELIVAYLYLDDSFGLLNQILQNKEKNKKNEKGVFNND